MRVLLDTNAFLWWVSAGADRLGERARWAIEEPDNTIFLSVASAWEIAIKSELGRLSLPAAAERYLPDLLARSGIGALEIQLAHVLRAGGLPPHHRDPFDRLLVAQSQIEDVPIVTAEPAIGRYDVEVIW